MRVLKDSLLAVPLLYQAFQELGGFYAARLTTINKYLKPKAGERIIDIGCGPGYLARDLPDGVAYLGFDLDHRYIEFAKRRFGERGQFFCCQFDHAAAKTFGPADIVMMNGVLHHISDVDVATTLAAVHGALRPGGVLFTLDGAYTDAQPRFSRFLLDHDRGRYVRTPGQYVNLLKEFFVSVESHTHEELARVPYTFFIAVSRKAAG
jgi:2-polyprenyl-3-methyl-5-hydroxy-6-metoxy-1,4-benzoquinol methylase